MNNNYENAIANRYEFVMLYDVVNGNPNGDPDAGNLPRLDPETGNGIVTDVCIKRKIRNCVQMRHGDQAGFNIYIRQDAILNEQDQHGLEAVKEIKDKEAKSKSFRDAMCGEYYDIRTFGAVMTSAATDKSLFNVAGQVRGPVQLAFGRSVEPIVPREITVTRVAVTTAKDAEAKGTHTMGRKSVVPYGLYRQEGYVSANLARTITGFSEKDLEVLWEAIIHMFDEDRSAARGQMALRELIVFKHESPLGNAPAHKLFDRVKVARNEDVAVPRKYADYVVAIDMENLPTGVTVERKYRDDI